MDDIRQDSNDSHQSSTLLVDNSAKIRSYHASHWPPKTLVEWASVLNDRASEWSIVSHARSLWDPLEAFFLSQGYRLFVYDNEEYDVPANRDEIRAEDPYHVFIWDRVPSRFYCPRNKLCAATRLSNGTHVVLQLLAIGEDGQEEVKIQKRLHHNPLSTRYPNRAVPLLDILAYDKEQMVFGVFPLLCAAHDCPQVSKHSEAFKLCHAWMECIAYLHENLVAHMDIGPQEFLVNYGGPLDDAWLINTRGHYGPFYQLFKPQWWITDFGESVCYTPDSLSDERKVVGLCAGKLTYPIAHYPKMLGPEVWQSEKQGKPYCPFKHDVYQLGKTLRFYIHGLADAQPKLDEILLSMANNDPELRPSMREVLEAMHDLSATLTQEELDRNRSHPGMGANWQLEHRNVLSQQVIHRNFT